jgi:hypothetical protein
MPSYFCCGSKLTLKHVKAVAAAALISIIAVHSPQAAPQGTPLEAASPRQAAIKSAADLDRYLKASTSSLSPLDRLTPGARERFLMSLQFGSKGLVGFDSTDLADELTQDQIRDVLALFGKNIEAFAPTSRLTHKAVNAARPVSKHAGISDVERRYNLFYRADREASDRDYAIYPATLAERFDALFTETEDPAALEPLDDRDLRLLSRATATVARTSPQPRYIASFQNVVAERERRGLVVADDVKMLQRVLLLAQHFDAARTLASRYPDVHLPALPSFHDPLGESVKQSTVWRLDANALRMTRTAIDLGPTQILVTAGCHFSEDAAEDISKDPILGPVFLAHAHWLVQAPGTVDIDVVRNWNRRFPRAQVEMIHDDDEWKLSPIWRTPVFYIVRDGKVIDKVIGWSRDPTESRQPLIDALHRAGLLTIPK